MNSRTLLIAIAFGLGSALMLIAPVGMGALGAMFSYLALVPLFVAALGFGTLPGIISALVAGCVLIFSHGLTTGFGIFATMLAPAVWIGHSCGLAQETDEGTEWFPLSQILLRLVLMAIMMSVLFVLVSGYSPEAMQQQIRDMFADLYSQMDAGSGKTVTTAEIDQAADRIAVLMPLFFPITLLIMLVLNLALAAKITRNQGWMLRPRDDIPTATALPMFTLAIFAAAVVVSGFDGFLGFLGKTATGAFGCALVFVGLAALHDLTRALPIRGAILGGVYAIIILFGLPAVLILFFGIAETLFNFRARRGSQTHS